MHNFVFHNERFLLLKVKKLVFLKKIGIINSLAVGMVVAWSYGVEIDFVRNPIFRSDA